MREQVVKVVAPFLNFMTRYVLAKAHNMLSLMLDPRHKDLSLVGNFVGRVSTTNIAEEYDTKLLIRLLVGIYRKPYASDIQLSATSNSFPLQQSSNAVLVQVSSRRTLQMSMSAVSPTIAYLARQILGIVGSQIETERVFTIAGILMAFCRCRLGTRNLEQLVVLVKNWPDPTLMV